MKRKSIGRIGTVLAAATLAAGVAGAAPNTVNRDFDGDATGGVPTFFRFEGSPGLPPERWKAVPDVQAYSKSQVGVQSRRSGPLSLRALDAGGPVRGRFRPGPDPGGCARNRPRRRGRAVSRSRPFHRGARRLPRPDRHARFHARRESGRSGLRRDPVDGTGLEDGPSGDVGQDAARFGFGPRRDRGAGSGSAVRRGWADRRGSGPGFLRRSRDRDEVGAAAGPSAGRAPASSRRCSAPSGFPGSRSA